ncbi:MAG: hypothetical protein AAGA42_18985 [Actinomycetota bacterium]
MTTSGIGLVLAAGALHVAWNTLERADGDPLVALWTIVVGASLLSVPTLAIVGWPGSVVFGHIAISTALHVGRSG